MSKSAKEPRTSTDPIVESVCQKMMARSRLGMSKYESTLDRTDLSRLDWLRHAQEEAMDLANYLECLIKIELQNSPHPPDQVQQNHP